MDIQNNKQLFFIYNDWQDYFTQQNIFKIKALSIEWQQFFILKSLFWNYTVHMSQ